MYPVQKKTALFPAPVVGLIDLRVISVPLPGIVSWSTWLSSGQEYIRGIFWRVSRGSFLIPNRKPQEGIVMSQCHARNCPSHFNSKSEVEAITDGRVKRWKEAGFWMTSWAITQPIPALPWDFVKYEVIFPLLPKTFELGFFGYLGR